MFLRQQSNSPLFDLWQRYSAYKLWNGKGNSSNYKAIEFRLKRLNDNSTTQATIDGLFDKYSAHAFLETFRGLYSCCKWGKESKLIKVNPLEWLHLQIAPIQRDKLNLIKLKTGVAIESVIWNQLLPKPTGQEIVKLRIGENNWAVDGGYINASVQDLWFKFGEPPVLLMTARNGYWAIRKTVVTESEYLSPTIRRVLFDQNYLEVKGIPLLHLHAKERSQATLPLSALQALSPWHV